MRRAFILLVMAFLVAGCMTQRDKTAVVRSAKNYAATGQPERAQEMTEVAIDCGALRLDPATGAVIPGDVDPAMVEDTPEAAAANAAGIAVERRARLAMLTFGQALGKELLDRLPWGGSAVAVLSALWALYRNRAVKGAATAAVGAINDFKHFTEKVREAINKPDAETDWNALHVEGATLLERLKTAGASGASAWKELAGIHAAMKKAA